MTRAAGGVLEVLRVWAERPMRSCDVGPVGPPLVQCLEQGPVLILSLVTSTTLALAALRRVSRYICTRDGVGPISAGLRRCWLCRHHLTRKIS